MRGLPDEIIKPPTTSNNKLAPKLSNFGTKPRVKFNRSCLKQDKITYTHGATVIKYIVYELSLNLNYNKNVTLENRSFWCSWPFPSWAFLCTLSSWSGVKLLHLDNFWTKSATELKFGMNTFLYKNFLKEKKNQKSAKFCCCQHFLDNFPSNLKLL